MSERIISLTPEEVNRMLATGEMRIIGTPEGIVEAEPGISNEVREMVDKETSAWSGFLGKDIEIPSPPQELLDTIKRIKEAGLTNFEPHFLPQMEFKKDDQYPGWKIKPLDWCWEQMKNKKISEDAAKLGGYWCLLDTTKKPNYDERNGNQLYPDDPFVKILENLRTSGRIAVPEAYKDVPPTSRFALSKHEIQTEFMPALAKLLRVSEENVRLPRAIEFNILGNLFYPGWGETDTWEWFDDRFEVFNALFGGQSRRSGLAVIDWLGFDGRVGSIGFRPLVVFPN